MPGTKDYHSGLQQPYRIQKRLVLNQCFKSILSSDTVNQTLNYVTFGGEDLYDVMDLVSVFNIKQLELRVVSYEADNTVAVKSRTCPVATSLSRIDSVSVDIVAFPFGENHRPIQAIRSQGSFIYFLDYTGIFQEPQADVLMDLLRSDLLREHDYLLITSCLTPRVVHRPQFMRRHEGTYRTFFGPHAIVDQEFKVRNHVDLFVAQTLSRFQGIRPRARNFLRASLLKKYRYNDTRAVMGLWLFQLSTTTDRTFLLHDAEFEDFPHAFRRVAEDEDIPNIFD